MAKPKYVEVSRDGFTVAGVVHRAGDVVEIPEEQFQSSKQQVARWGEPRYSQISESDFVERGGRVGGRPAQSQPIGHGPEARAEEFGDPYAPESAEKLVEAQDESEQEFADLEGLNVDQTLDAVASYDDTKTQRFIEHEKANRNRSGVLGPLGAE